MKLATGREEEMLDVARIELRLIVGVEPLTMVLKLVDTANLVFVVESKIVGASPAAADADADKRPFKG